jgi:SAM-dependent methyltransferase
VRQDDDTAVRRRSFGIVAGEYDRLRSGPPPDALDWLLPEGTQDALEIGAGTGLLTRPLAARVPHVTAIEPDDRMRAVLSGSAPDVDVRAGQAEELPVESAAYDVVLAASAWHWVDEERAVPEVTRVLRPCGRLALVWSGPDRSVDWMRSLWAGGIVFSPEERDTVDQQRRSRRIVNVDVGGTNRFGPSETSMFRWTRPMSREDLVALASTYSVVITMDDTARERHLAAMRRFLDAQDFLAGRDIVDVPMRAYCWRADKV